MIFLFYTNSFLMKRRKKEFGLLNILGMGKKHIALVIFCETLILLLVSLVLGIGLGILFDKLMFLLLMKLLGAAVSGLSFQILLRRGSQHGADHQRDLPADPAQLHPPDSSGEAHRALAGRRGRRAGAKSQLVAGRAGIALSGRGLLHQHCRRRMRSPPFCCSS